MKKLVREHWTNFEKNFQENLSNLRNHDFTLKYKKNNFNLNLFFADFMLNKNKILNFNDKKNKDISKDDAEIKKI